MRVVCKGAPEYVAKFCTKILNAQGEPVDVDSEEMERLVDTEITQNLCKKYGLRCLAYAYKDLDSNQWEDLQATHNNFSKESDRDIIESDLTFVCCFALRD